MAFSTSQLDTQNRYDRRRMLLGAGASNPLPGMNMPVTGSGPGFLSTGAVGGFGGVGVAGGDPYLDLMRQQMAMQQQFQTNQQNALSGLVGDFQNQQNAAKAANEQRYGQALGMAKDLRARSLQNVKNWGAAGDKNWGALTNSAMGAIGDWNKAGTAQLAGMRNRTMGYLDQLGGTQRRDIDQRFKTQAGQIEGDALNRGLGNTTIRPSLLNANEYNRSRANLDLNEMLAGQRLNAENALGGREVDFLNNINQTRLGTMTNLGQNRINFGTDVAKTGLGTDISTTNDIIGLMERRQDEYPDFGQLASLAGMVGQYGGGPAGLGGTAAVGGGAAKVGRGAPVARTAPAKPAGPVRRVQPSMMAQVPMTPQKPRRVTTGIGRQYY